MPALGTGFIHRFSTVHAELGFPRIFCLTMGADHNLTSENYRTKRSRKLLVPQHPYLVYGTTGT